MQLSDLLNAAVHLMCSGSSLRPIVSWSKISSSTGVPPCCKLAAKLRHLSKFIAAKPPCILALMHAMAGALVQYASACMYRHNQPFIQGQLKSSVSGCRLLREELRRQLDNIRADTKQASKAVVAALQRFTCRNQQ